MQQPLLAAHFVLLFAADVAGGPEASGILDEALVIFLDIAQREIFVGVFDADFRVFVHPSLDDFHLLAADAVADGQGGLAPEVNLCGA